FTSFAADTIDFEAIGDTLALDATTTIDLNGSDLNFNGGLLMLDDSAQNVGIGTATPATKLEVNGTTLATTMLTKTVTNNTTAATITVDWNVGNKQKVTLNQAGHTVNFTNPTGGIGSFSLIIYQDGTGSRTVTTWDTDIKWPSGTAPTLSSTASALDVITCIYDGTNYLCQAGLDFQ
ncbi:MAG: hypothetical protein O3C63_07175, partial [Cyanobacteria bacterium]|nr:hypothetical protein [Cyanobacteriota bacterium]